MRKTPARISAAVWRKFRHHLIGRNRHARKCGVTIGENCRIYIEDWGSEPFLINIGNNVTITSGVKMLTHDGATSLVKDSHGRRFQKYAPITIGNNVFIGVNSILMPGISIGDNCVVGAGSVVTKDIAENSVVGGNPARVITDFPSFAKKIKNSCASESQLLSENNYVGRVMTCISIQRERLEK